MGVGGATECGLGVLLSWPLPRPLPQVLIDWINDVLVEDRIIVKQLEEDLFDGQVLQKLLGESPAGGSPSPSPHSPQRAQHRATQALCVATWVTRPESGLGASAPSPQLPGGVAGPWASGRVCVELPASGCSGSPHSFQNCRQLPRCRGHTAKGSRDTWAQGPCLAHSRCSVAVCGWGGVSERSPQACAIAVPQGHQGCVFSF